MSIKSYLTKQKNKKQWRKLNPQNSTVYDIMHCDMTRVHVGRYTYGGLQVSSPNPEHELFIGDFCSIGTGVWFLLGSDHRLDRISTFPFREALLGTGIDATSKGDIVVGDDVWIGQNAIILSGVHIGQGAVIAAGAVVAADVPPYAIVGGVPAKVIRYRFEPEMIEELLKVDYSKLAKEEIEAHIQDLQESLKEKRQLDWMPKK